MNFNVLLTLSVKMEPVWLDSQEKDGSTELRKLHGTEEFHWFSAGDVSCLNSGEHLCGQLTL